MIPSYPTTKYLFKEYLSRSIKSTKTYNKIQAVISVMNKRQSRVRRPRMVGIVAGLDGEVREGLPEEVTSEANEGRK